MVVSVLFAFSGVIGLIVSVPGGKFTLDGVSNVILM